MENRGRKRAELAESLPADKRACSEYQTGSSSSSAPNPNSHSAPEAPDCDMDSSSSASVSGRSEGEAEKDSAYGSCDSDGIDDAAEHRRKFYLDIHRRLSGENQARFKAILPNLAADAGPSSQLAALTDLCDVLSLCNDDSLSGFSFESFVPCLVSLVNHEGSPDIMLLAIRAITYLCDMSRRSSAILVRYDAVPVLCARLMVIEYLDVAEQCLQALEKISSDHPAACLKAGAIMAVLSYIDFFSTSVQRVAVSTVANICRKLHSDCSAQVMEAIPILCNLLQYEDRRLVETVALILMRIVECLSRCSEMLDELCKHGVIHQSTHLLALHSRATLSQPTYTGLIGMLATLASGSLVAVKTLFELNVSSTMKEILMCSDLSHDIPHSRLSGVHSNQIHEVLKLLNVLLPPSVGDAAHDLVSDKEKILIDLPELLHRFGMDILPVLIQVVKNGASIYVCYGCLSVINKLVYFCSADMLLDLLKNANISSFLASVFAQNDHHLLISALKTADLLMQKLPEIFSCSFVKEGVVYAVDALLMLEQLSDSLVQKPRNVHSSASKDVRRCLCYTFDIGRSSLSSETGGCKLEKSTVQSLANHLKVTYFAGEPWDSHNGLTETVHKLRTFCASLTDNVNMSTSDLCADEYYSHLLEQIMAELNGSNPLSTFEFIESGVVKSLIHYLSNGKYLKEKVNHHLPNDHWVVLKRFETFVKILFTSLYQQSEDTFLKLLVQKLQNALSSLDQFAVIVSHAPKSRDVYANIPGCSTKHPCLRVRFVREEGEAVLCNYPSDVLMVDALSSLDDIEKYLWPKVCTNIVEESVESTGKNVTDDLNTASINTKENSLLGSGCKDTQGLQDSHMQSSTKQELNCVPDINADMKTMDSISVYTCCDCQGASKMIFYLKGKELERSLTLYQAMLQQSHEDNDIVVGPKFWYEVYEVKYRRALEPTHSNCQKFHHDFKVFSPFNHELVVSWQRLPFFSCLLVAKLPCNLEKSNPTYDVLFLLKFLEGLNRFTFHLMCHERIKAFSEGRTNNFDDLKVITPAIPQADFVSSRLTEKLEQQMRDPLAVSFGGMPPWCNQLMAACPFVFNFEARRKYFHLTAFGLSEFLPPLSQQWTGINANGTSDRQLQAGVLQREKFHVHRSHILESAAQMMNLHAHNHAILEVEYDEEVGTGLGPTMEFYTLVSHEFQMVGLGMWREEHSSRVVDSEFVIAPLGLFPRPWLPESSSSNGMEFSEVIKKFFLLGQVVARALKDGRVLDLPFSKAFYKLILEQELDIYDIYSFDPELGRTLIEFQALVERKRNLDSLSGKHAACISDLHFRDTRIEDLCLEFTLPGYADYKLATGPDHKMVTIMNLEEYISLIVDATVKSGTLRQVEAFKSGFNQVFPLKALQIFTEDEIERLLCGERDTWVSGELLDYIKFDHGYTASSPSIINLLEIIQEFGCDQRRAFLQFVTGAPRLPPGGLAALNPRLTIVRKHWSKWPDADLPSVMTCANYLKLPPYSSKERMRERLLYAITEGQGSFHLS